MGYAARVSRKRACRHNCLLKVERTAAELKAHDVVGHPRPEPEPFVTRPVFTAKAEQEPRKPVGARQRRLAHRRRKRASVKTFGLPTLT